MKNLVRVVSFLVLFGSTTLGASATSLTFNTRASFEAALGSTVTDTYENPGYAISQSDAQMSAVLGETDYHATGFPDFNQVVPTSLTNHVYCSGCNGSFLLTFTSTSVGSNAGVYGAGLDIFANTSTPPFSAAVTFADGSTNVFALGGLFFGITSNDLIRSIHFGTDGFNPSTTFTGIFAIDNVTIGRSAVAPVALGEPHMLLLILAALLIALRARSRA